MVRRKKQTGGVIKVGEELLARIIAIIFVVALIIVGWKENIKK